MGWSDRSYKGHSPRSTSAKKIHDIGEEDGDEYMGDYLLRVDFDRGGSFYTSNTSFGQLRQYRPAIQVQLVAEEGYTGCGSW